MSTKKSIKKKTIPKSLRVQVWDTYIGKEKGFAPCYCCNNIEIRQTIFDCGHVIAEANGGETTLENLRPICSTCNTSMGTTNLEEYKKTYHPNQTKIMNTSNLNKMCELLMTHNGSIFTLPYEPCCSNCNEWYHRPHQTWEHFDCHWAGKMSSINNYCKKIINKEQLAGHEIKDMIIKLDCLHQDPNKIIKYANRLDEIKYDVKKGLSLIPTVIQELENYQDKLDGIKK
jgi:hypothetical protein